MNELSTYIKKYGIAFCCALLMPAMHAMNVIRPYQILLRPPKVPGSWLQLYTIGQFGFDSQSFNACGDHVNPLQIYQCDQDALAMLNGFDPSSAIGQKRIRVDANDDGVRGHLTPCADFRLNAALRFGARFFMPYHLSLAIYLPYYDMELKNVTWCDQTEDVSVQDMRTKAYLTDCICENVACLGCLDIGGWHRKGVGDTTVSLEWIKDFPQQKPTLHNVTINGRLGITLPSGLHADEDKLLAFPFGNDDGIGIVFGLGLDLYIGQYLKAGLDVQLMHIFGHTRCRRIKTALAQTDLLLLGKAEAFADYGLTQQFSFYGQLYRWLGGASIKVAYQFYKRGQDQLFLSSNEFSSEIANSAESLLAYTTHDAFVILDYDFTDHTFNRFGWTPYVAGFVNIPFNGKRSIVAKTAGFVLGLNF